MTGRPLVLDLTDDLPDRLLAPGDLLYEQGVAEHASVSVLVHGRLAVSVAGDRLPDVTQPGSFVGEVGALLSIPRTATVMAVEPTTVRVVGDASTLFASHPELSLELARQLAGRLHRLTSYLADVRAQYAGASGHLGLVDSILGRIASRPPVEIDAGSDRSPDY